MIGSELKIPRFTAYRGSLGLPGSKSIANRALLCAALSTAKTQLHNLPPARDVEVLLKALSQLGVSVVQSKPEQKASCGISGSGGPFCVAQAQLQLENAGTAIRPLTAILCASQGDYLLRGNARMHQRPIAPLVQALQGLGVDIHCSSNGCPPVHIHAKGLPGGKLNLSARDSSQFVSALLFAAPLAKGDIEIYLDEEPVSQPYIELSIAVLRKFRISVEKKSSRHYYVPAPQSYTSIKDFHIEGDATAATYFLGAAALPGCGPVRVHGLGSDSIQGDLKFIGLLEQMGAQVKIEENAIEVRGPQSKDLERLHALDVNMNAMPDAAMTLAVLALFARGTTHIRGISNLRLKESNRIQGLKRELERLGAEVTEEKDSLHITASTKLRSAVIETYDDHRMAMAFALAAYGANITIKNPACVSKTYRNFFNDFLPLCLSEG